jgi:very-short-patch-repair endonuclease
VLPFLEKAGKIINENSPPFQGGVARSAGVVDPAVIHQTGPHVVVGVPVHNRPSLKLRRRALRGSLTPAEARLWKYLQRSQLEGRKFRRQHSVGPFILDFYSPAAKVAIELDGAAHDHHAAQLADATRDQYLSSLGIIVLRVENREVIVNLEGVLLRIREQFSAV